MKRNDPFDILITGGTLLTMSADGGVVENPVVGIRDGRIALIEKGRGNAPAAYAAAESLDASGCVILPGLINTHTHLPMVCFRGMADDLPLLEWLQRCIFPAEARYVNRDMVYAGARLAMAEMILSGTTTFCDGYFHASSVAHAALDMGMRGVVSQGFLDLEAAGPPDSANNIAVAETFLDKWSGRSPLISPALFCHTPYTCTARTLKSLKAVARQKQALYIMHVAETMDENRILAGRCNLTSVRYLQQLDVLDAGTVAVHAVWVDAQEMDILQETGTRVSHNPESNMKLASGIAPVAEMLRRGIPVGLGTDGCASNNDLDLFREMATAARLHKVATMDPTVLDAGTVLKMVTLGGARVLGMEDRIGSVEAGKCADLILVRMDRPHLTPVYQVCSHLVYAASGADVTASIIDGKLVMKNRRLLRVDLRDILEPVRRIADAIQKGRPLKNGFAAV